MATRDDVARRTPAFRLRVVSFVETLTFVVLLWMMLTGNETGVSIVGAIHGVLFLGYAFLVLRDREEFQWGPVFVAVAILTGPIGPILVLEKLRHHA